MHREFPLNTDLQVDESTMRCPYLPDREARLVYWLPQTRWTKTEFDRRLAEGQRRHGSLVYEPHCDGCQECVSLRINVHDFKPSKTQRRILNRGNRELVAHFARPVCDDERLRLLNKHTRWRGWSEASEIPASHYEFTFVNSIFNSFEISYYWKKPDSYEQQLVGIAICDEGETGISAVYTYYDPDFRHLSLGTYSVLYQIELCKQVRVPYLYLGYYVQDCASLNYKAKYVPHQKLLDGQWVEFQTKQMR